MSHEQNAAGMVRLNDNSLCDEAKILGYYNAFQYLKSKKPDLFHKLCARVFCQAKLPLTEEHKAILIEIGLADRTLDSQQRIQLHDREELVTHLLMVCVQPRAPGIVDRLKSLFNGDCAQPVYDIISPFAQEPMKKSALDQLAL